MLQQTQIATALPYFERWVQRWPDWNRLAQASEDEVLSAWTGLGYYQRARRLLALAKVVVTEHGGILPSRVEDLLRLPGLGPYASEAVAAIAYNQPAFPVDGNVRRVLSRYYGDGQISPSKEQDARFRSHLLPTFTRIRRRRELAQALMELGALVCKPRQPLCHLCPLRMSCHCHDPATAMTFPVKGKKVGHRKKILLFVWYCGPKTVLLRKRPPGGRFPSQWEPISCEGETREEAMGQLSKIIPEKALGKIEWHPAFRRDFTTFQVHWVPGILISRKEPVVPGYENIVLEEAGKLNLVSAMADHWSKHRPGAPTTK